VPELLLGIVKRGERCAETAAVREAADADESVGVLVCSLGPNHPGPLHYDAIDGIWWAQ
jgi:hypothetical protein